LNTMTHNIKEGQFTSTIYGMIKEHRYKEAVGALNHQLTTHPDSRAALSLLGYCFYQMQDFVSASDSYERLAQLCPESPEYQLYFAQSLYQAGLFQQAIKVVAQIENPAYRSQMLKLEAAIKFGEEDFAGSRALVDQCPKDDPDTLINIGCLLYKEGNYQEACAKFTQAMKVVSFRPDLAYNIAICHYQMRQYAQALKFIADVIEKGIRDHPELGVGMTTEGIEVRSVGNSLTLHETALVEAFNLKAAIEFNLHNVAQAQDALTDMPPRSEEELDPVTLHNLGLMNMEADAAGGFQRLQFLLQQESFPPETLGNLLLLYVKFDYHDLAADVLAESTELAYKLLPSYLLDFLEAVILCQTAPEEAYRRLDEMATRQTETLRKLTKMVQQARQKHDDEAVKRAVNEYDEALERYIPVLMQQAKIYWDRENYQEVEKIFRNSVEFCNDHDAWKLNVAHVLFMREKYRESASFYEPIVKKNYENIMGVSAAVLANLCVSYIMVSQNEDAEELMRKIEKDEEQVAYDDPDKKIFHSCIVNLVIGTLYCSKGNYEFGISRIIKSMEPFQKKLGTDTWYYAKRCFLSLLENLAKHMIILKDSATEDCAKFLELCERYGYDVKAFVENPLAQKDPQPGRNSVTFEARVLRSMLFAIADV
ncbi:hypothetical protein BOX15_Mlig015039g2, partial [Macrostomum lignano]